MPVKCPQIRASRVDLILEKNKRECLFIRELRVWPVVFGKFLETAKKQPTQKLEELRNSQRQEIGNF